MGFAAVRRSGSTARLPLFSTRLVRRGRYCGTFPSQKASFGFSGADSIYGDTFTNTSSSPSRRSDTSRPANGAGIGKQVKLKGPRTLLALSTLISTKAYYLIFLVTILAKTFFTLVGRHLVTLMFLSVRHNCNCLKFLLFI